MTAYLMGKLAFRIPVLQRVSSTVAASWQRPLSFVRLRLDSPQGVLGSAAMIVISTAMVERSRRRRDSCYIFAPPAGIPSEQSRFPRRRFPQGWLAEKPQKRLYGIWGRIRQLPSEGKRLD